MNLSFDKSRLPNVLLNDLVSDAFPHQSPAARNLQAPDYQLLPLYLYVILRATYFKTSPPNISSY